MLQDIMIVYIKVVFDKYNSIETNKTLNLIFYVTVKLDDIII